MHTRAVFLTGCLLLASAGCERPVITHATPPPLPASIDRLDPAVVALLRTRHAAVVADPANATEWRALALAAEANELFDTALACVTEAVRLDPGAPRGWYQLGRLATRAGDLDRAREAFETTARLAPAYAPALWRAGRVDLERGRFVEAEAAFERALAIDAALPAARIGLARAWLGQDRVAEAARLLEEESANADPAARPYTLHLLATARRRLGQRSDPSPAAAAPTWSDPWTSELATYRPGYGARIEAARRDLDAGRRAAAEATLRRLHAETPDNPVVTATLARVVRETGRPGEALALLDGIVAARPGFFPAHFERAVTLAQVAATLPPSEAEEARARADRAATRVLELNPSYAPAHALRGDLATVAGGLAAATRHYADAQRCDRTDPRWPQRCGIAALRRGDWPAAEDWLERALAMRPEDAETHRGLAIAYMSQGRLEAADATLSRAEALQPGDPRIARTRRDLRALSTGTPP